MFTTRFARLPTTVPLLALCFLIFGSSAVRAAHVYTDDLGRTVTINRQPHRVISLAPSVTEIIYAVGGAPDLVADTLFCDYPKAATTLPHVGGVIAGALSYEKMVALHPDLIIAASATLPSRDADLLSQRCHAPVFVTDAQTYNGVIQDIRTIGQMVGTPKATNIVAKQMVATREAVANDVAGLQKPKCFVVIWGKPLWTASGKSYWGDLIRLAGGSNVAENELLPYPQYSEEMLVADQPDVILQSVATPGKQPSVDAIAHLNLPAFKHHRLYGIYQNWIDRPGPRLALGLRALAQDLHPGSVK